MRYRSVPDIWCTPISVYIRILEYPITDIGVPDIGYTLISHVLISEELRHRVYPDIGVYTDIGVSDIAVTPMSEFLTSYPVFFSWQVLGSSGQHFQIPAAASRSWLYYCFSTFNLARGAILKCIGLYLGVACVAAVAPAAAAGSGGGVPSAAHPAGPAVFLVVL